MLTPIDQSYLTEMGWAHTVTVENGMLSLVIEGFRLPPGYSRAAADILIHFPAGYPDTPLDMWWFSPAITRADGHPIPATESSAVYLGRSWQRWSRHYQAGQWQPGIDNLRSYIARIRGELGRCAAPPVLA